MSTDASSLSTPGNPSVRAAGSGFAAYRSGASRYARPAQLDPALIGQLDGGADPQEISELSHTTAAVLLDRVHHTQDPETVDRVLTLVETEGIDLIAKLWSKAAPDSLPGILWRLYVMRLWMRRNTSAISRLWREGEPVETSASAIAGIDVSPSADDIARTADSILAGAFTGDFAVALERAAAFCEVISRALVKRAAQPASLSTSRKLASTAASFRHGAQLWRDGSLY
ncbi:thymidine phosphorylase [Scardovia wiggsiae]|uniref:thymidine phosphorylase n=1 Tax=Scardovia wiggsiae TaxID=230143 RepID=UPI00374F3745